MLGRFDTLPLTANLEVLRPLNLGDLLSLRLASRRLRYLAALSITLSNHVMVDPRFYRRAIDSVSLHYKDRQNALQLFATNTSSHNQTLAAGLTIHENNWLVGKLTAVILASIERCTKTQEHNLDNIIHFLPFLNPAAALLVRERLYAKLQDRNFWVSKQMYVALGRLPILIDEKLKAEITYLVEELNNPESQNRDIACFGVLHLSQYLGERLSDCMRPVIQLLDSNDEHFYNIACKTLEKFSLAAPEKQNDIVTALLASRNLHTRTVRVTLNALLPRLTQAQLDVFIDAEIEKTQKPEATVEEVYRTLLILNLILKSTNIKIPGRRFDSIKKELNSVTKDDELYHVATDLKVAIVLHTQEVTEETLSPETIVDHCLSRLNETDDDIAPSSALKHLRQLTGRISNNLVLMAITKIFEQKFLFFNPLAPHTTETLQSLVKTSKEATVLVYSTLLDAKQEDFEITLCIALVEATEHLEESQTTVIIEKLMRKTLPDSPFDLSFYIALFKLADHLSAGQTAHLVDQLVDKYCSPTNEYTRSLAINVMMAIDYGKLKEDKARFGNIISKLVNVDLTYENCNLFLSLVVKYGLSFDDIKDVLSSLEHLDIGQMLLFVLLRQLPPVSMQSDCAPLILRLQVQYNTVTNALPLLLNFPDTAIKEHQTRLHQAIDEAVQLNDTERQALRFIINQRCKLQVDEPPCEPGIMRIIMAAQYAKFENSNYHQWHQCLQKVGRLSVAVFESEIAIALFSDETPDIKKFAELVNKTLEQHLPAETGYPYLFPQSFSTKATDDKLAIRIAEKYFPHQIEHQASPA